MSEGAVQPEMLDHFVREELNRTALRVMAVLHPLKVVLTNFPHTEVLVVKYGHMCVCVGGGGGAFMCGGHTCGGVHVYRQSSPKCTHASALPSQISS